MKQIQLHEVKPGQVVSLSLKEWRDRKAVTIVSTTMEKTDLGYQGAVVYNDGKTNKYKSSKHGGAPVILVRDVDCKKKQIQLIIE